MRIAVVHSFYNSRVPSGENVAVDAQVRALGAGGHEVAVASQHSDTRMLRRSYPLEAAATTITGLGPDPTRELRAFAPDVVHVHNLFPNFGTRWLTGWRGPVVATLHNFRPMCAAGTLSREGRICTECVDGDRWAALRHRCYRGSAIATLPLAWRNRQGAPGDAVVRRADALVVISERARDLYVHDGVARSRVHVVENFVEPAPAASAPAAGRGSWLFVGRLTAEKGLAELLRVWPAGERLDVIGDGPERERLAATAPADIRFLGQLPHDEVRARMPGHLGLMFPSVCFEAGASQVYLEALAAGLPTLAVAGNGTSDDIAQHALGVVVPPDPDVERISGALRMLRATRSTLTLRCRSSFETRFTAERWLDAVDDVYQQAIRGGSATSSTEPPE